MRCIPLKLYSARECQRPQLSANHVQSWVTEESVCVTNDWSHKWLKNGHCFLFPFKQHQKHRSSTFACAKQHMVVNAKCMPPLVLLNVPLRFHFQWLILSLSSSHLTKHHGWSIKKPILSKHNYTNGEALANLQWWVGTIYWGAIKQANLVRPTEIS